MVSGWRFGRLAPHFRCLRGGLRECRLDAVPTRSKGTANLICLLRRILVSAPYIEW